MVSAPENMSPTSSPHESLTTEAPLVTAVCSAASRLESKQSCAPTNSIVAWGAIVCEDSTSSACSGYQPLPPHSAWSSTVAGSTLTNCDEFSGIDGSYVLKYCCASESSVGES